MFDFEVLNFALNRIYDGIIVVDKNMNVVFSNEAVSPLLPENKPVINGTQLGEYIPKAAVYYCVQGIFNNEAQGKVVHLTHKDGERRIDIDVSECNSGGEKYVVLFIKDVTLEVKERYLRKDFFSNMAHKLKTPITSIQGFAELLAAGVAKDEEQRNNFVERIINETRKLTLIINDILLISKLECDDNENFTSEFSIKNTAFLVENDMAKAAEEANIRINVKSDDVTVVADENHMVLLLTNLISNAVRYNEEGGFVQVNITAQGENLKIEVEDGGIGITDAAKSRVFERFYRAPEAKIHCQNGVGLGLSVVKHIAEFYGGSVSVETKLGIGSKFTAVLPIVKVKTEKDGE